MTRPIVLKQPEEKNATEPWNTKVVSVTHLIGSDNMIFFASG